MCIVEVIWGIAFSSQVRSKRFKTVFKLIVGV